MTERWHGLVLIGVLTCSGVLLAERQPAHQRSEVDLIIGDRIGAPPRLAVPDCLALSDDSETTSAATTIAQVLWQDLEFEREFRMVARDTYTTISPARSLVDLPFDSWRELGADGVVSCTVERIRGDQARVTARLFNVRSLESAFGVEYTGPLSNVRIYAHQLSDEIHSHQRGLKGLARTKISFISDRDSESMLGLVEDRATKEVYLSDYDGFNVRRVTVSRSLNTTPACSKTFSYHTFIKGGLKCRPEAQETSTTGCQPGLRMAAR